MQMLIFILSKDGKKVKKHIITCKDREIRVQVWSVSLCGPTILSCMDVVEGLAHNRLYLSGTDTSVTGVSQLT
jgi:hypothetical protein